MSADEGGARPAWQGEIEIAAPAAAVWRALVEPELIARWMLGARVESSWEVGAPIVFHVTLNRATYRDMGTILEIVPGEVLRYDQWSRVTRLPDTPQNRGVTTLRLTPTPAGTRLSVHYAPPPAEAALEHGAFFWRATLIVIKGIVEGTAPA